MNTIHAIILILTVLYALLINIIIRHGKSLQTGKGYTLMRRLMTDCVE